MADGINNDADVGGEARGQQPRHDEENRVVEEQQEHLSEEEVEDEHPRGEEAESGSSSGESDDEIEINPNTNPNNIPNPNTAQLYRAKLRAVSVRRPQPMLVTDDIALYLEAFDNYTSVIGLPPGDRYKALLSYLPDKFRLKLRGLGLSEAMMKKWKKVMRTTITTLTPPAEKLEVRLKLDKATQEEDESIGDFVERLRLLVEKCYDKPAEKPVRERVLKDLLVRGLADERVKVEVLSNMDTLTLDKLVHLAIRRELAVQATEKSNKVKDGTLSILNVQGGDHSSPAALPQPTLPTHPTRYYEAQQQQPNSYGRRCYLCDSEFHFASSCHSNPRMQYPRSPSGSRRQGNGSSYRNPVPQNRGRSVRCYQCQGPHFQRDCPYLAQSRGNRSSGRASNSYRRGGSYSNTNNRRVNFHQSSGASNNNTAQQPRWGDSERSPSQHHYLEEIRRQGGPTASTREADRPVRAIRHNSALNMDIPEDDSEDGEQMYDELTGEFLNFSFGDEDSSNF
jgi:hypothetical protein